MANIYEYENKINQLIDYFKQGNNIFLTGKAGTGKSHFIRNYFKNQANTVLLSLYNTAARNIEGSTIHNFFDLDFRTNHYKNNSDKNFSLLIKNVKTIVIDEIFSVRVDLLDVIDEILRKSMNNNLPFGGKQMILVGDVFQLIPIVTKNVISKLSEKYSSSFFFDSRAYQNAEWKIVNLTYNFRHLNESFDNILDNIRTNEISPEEIELLNNKMIPQDDLIDDAIELVPTKAAAEYFNGKYLDSIDNPTGSSLK